MKALKSAELCCSSSRREDQRAPSLVDVVNDNILAAWLDDERNIAKVRSRQAPKLHARRQRQIRLGSVRTGAQTHFAVGILA